MSFREDVAADVSGVILSTDEFAVTVVYDDGTTQKEISALVEFGQEWSEEAGFATEKALVRISTADVPNPERKHKVTIAMPDGREAVWTVAKVESGDGFMWVLNAYGKERPVF